MGLFNERGVVLKAPAAGRRNRGSRIVVFQFSHLLRVVPPQDRSDRQAFARVLHTSSDHQRTSEHYKQLCILFSRKRLLSSCRAK